MDKKTARQEIREKIQKLNQREIHKYNREINSHIVNSRLFLEGKVIMGYLGEPGEVNIDQSLQTALNMGKTVCVPQILEGPGEMAAARLVTLKKLGRDRYGIRTPQEPVETIAPEDIDLVLTPGLGFTAQGERLGRGAGYYDRSCHGAPKGFPWQSGMRCRSRKSCPPMPMTRKSVICVRKKDCGYARITENKEESFWRVKIGSSCWFQCWPS